MSSFLQGYSSYTLFKIKENLASETPPALVALDPGQQSSLEKTALLYRQNILQFVEACRWIKSHEEGMIDFVKTNNRQLLRIVGGGLKKSEKVWNNLRIAGGEILRLETEIKDLTTPESNFQKFSEGPLFTSYKEISI